MTAQNGSHTKTLKAFDSMTLRTKNVNFIFCFMTTKSKCIIMLTMSSAI